MGVFEIFNVAHPNVRMFSAAADGTIEQRANEVAGFFVETLLNIRRDPCFGLLPTRRCDNECLIMFDSKSFIFVFNKIYVAYPHIRISIKDPECTEGEERMQR